MTLVDRRDHPVTGATPRALELHETALAQFQCYRGDPLATIDQAIAEAPGFAMARSLKAYLGVMATEKPALAMARGELETLERLTLTPREAGHRASIRSFASGDWEGGIAALDAVLSEHPRDVLALQAVHLANFYTGDARNLRDAVARVRGAWDQEMPGYHAVLGMYAFGLEECGDYPRAEREGRRALELEPYDAWAHHAVTHVFEMQGRVEDGVRWITSREPYWAVDNFFAIHNWWHLTLFHLDRGEHDQVLELYDRRIRATGSKVVLDLVDASAMLWRLFLRGIDLGPRAAELADAWAPMVDDGLYVFNDVHAAMAFLCAGQQGRVATLLETMRNQAPASGSNGAMSAQVGLPAVKALAAFAGGDYGRTVDTLRRVRPIAHRFGGSHAQRDVLDQTLAEAALRGGDGALALALAREREELKPGHLVARTIRARALALRPGAAPR